LIIRAVSKNSVSFSLNNRLGGFSNLTILVFLRGFSNLVGVAMVSTCSKVLNDFKTDLFEVDPLIVITPVPFLLYQVFTFVSTGSSTKFEYSFAFPSTYRCFARMFLMSIWEIGRIVMDVTFDLADLEGIVDQKKSAVCCQIEDIVFPLLVDVLNMEWSDLSGLDFPICV